LIVLLDIDRLLSRTEGSGGEPSRKVNGQVEAGRPLSTETVEGVSVAEQPETKQESLMKGKN
jgi:hypothetical protein